MLIKTLAFLFIFLYLVPFLTALCGFFPSMRHVLFAAMLYFTSREVALNILPMPTWRGSARGYAFTAVSLFALPLFLSMVFSFRYKVRWFPPGWFFYFLYYLAIILSGVNAIHMHPWGFEVWRMFWMYITFLAAFNYLNHCRNLSFFIYLVACILIYAFIVGFDQKYRQGYFQIPSTFPHQNSLCLYLEIFGLMILGVLMNEKMSKLLFLLCLVAFGSSTLLVVFTYSRGGLVMFFGGIAVVCLLSLLCNGFSMRRLTLMLVGMIVMLCIIGYALPRIIQRFTKAPENSKNTRVNLAIASKRMANDYRLGVGANNFSEYSGPFRNYALEQYDSVSQTFLDSASWYGGIVETIYLLVAAECGWWGLGTLLLWFLYYYFVDLICVLMLRKMPCSGIVIGLFGGMTCVYVHSSLEWSLKQNNNFAQLMIVYALIGVIATHRKSIKAAYLRSLPVPPKKKASALPPVPPLYPPLPPPPKPTKPALPPLDFPEPESPAPAPRDEAETPPEPEASPEVPPEAPTGAPSTLST